LYHGQVIPRKPIEAGRLYIVGIEPPPNVVALLATYRGRLFSALAEPSARAFPELLPLVAARAIQGPPGSRPSIVRLERRRDPRLSARLSRAWEGVEGSFSAQAPFPSGKALYLGTEGPVAKAAAAVLGLLPDLGLEPASTDASLTEASAFDHPELLAANRAFFLCEPGEAAPGLEAALRSSPPGFTFRACRLVLYKLSFAEPPRSGISWEEVAFAWRPKGNVTK